MRCPAYQLPPWVYDVARLRRLIEQGLVRDLSRMDMWYLDAVDYMDATFARLERARLEEARNG